MNIAASTIAGLASPLLTTQLVDALDSGIAIVDRGHTIRYWNTWMVKASGIASEIAVGQRLSALFPETDLGRLQSAIADAVEMSAPRFLSHSLNPHLLPLVSSDGRPLLHNVTVRPLLAGDGEQLCLLQVVDVSARWRAQEALAEGERRYRAVFEQAGLGICEIDADGRFVRVNDRLCAITGYTRAELLRLRIQDLENPETERGEAFPWTATSIERACLRKDGASIWVNITCAPAGGDGERSAYWIVTFDDVTKRRQAEDALRHLTETLEAQVAERSQELDRIFKLSSDILGVFGTDGVFLHISPAWQRITGHKPESVLSRPFLEFIHPEDRQHTASEMERLLSGALVSGLENRYIHADGSVRWLSWTIRPIKEEGHFYATARDVTDQKKAEEQLRHAQKMEAVGQLTGGIAHDFNNLLQAIASNIEAVERKLAAGATDVSTFVHATLGAVQRAGTLTQRLLAFARRQPLSMEVVDLNALVTGMQDLIQRSVGASVKVEVVLGRDLWRTWADANQVENALLNLVINSRDAMPQGGRILIETASVPQKEEAGGTTPGDYVMMAVTDTGVGMPPDVMERAFEPFFTTKPVGQGTGLGLSQLYGFAQQCGGHVEIASEVGRGTTVRVYLPRYEGDEAVKTTEPEAQIHDGQEGATILMVEDEPLIRTVLQNILKNEGYRVFVASNAQSALRILKSSSTIDLLATDVGLPDTNGRQLAEMAREIRPDLKILFLTGYDFEASRERGEVRPGMNVLRKPFEVPSLLSKIKQLLAQD